ncbi:MAG TPA: hypothetical protein VE687_05295 [Stellaceae bacterium]|nr:hypothetical protein [Stellaceae bacterium]
MTQNGVVNLGTLRPWRPIINRDRQVIVEEIVGMRVVGVDAGGEQHGTGWCSSNQRSTAA